ncbi:hypothetical protein [Maricaulis sp.]|uniref:hypothetical protein n=1 Tax=Maricaulis sp. TaxID=1486257 RepID=UPI00261186B5|nr:hypothetical protein [Maricaulis sp.]
MSEEPTGRYVETDKVALGVWKRLTEVFSTSKLLGRMLIRANGTWPFRKDNLGEMLQTKQWKVGLGLLGGLDDNQIDFLERYAAINERRVDQVFRANALFLVTIPVGALIGINEVVPELFELVGVDFVYTLVTIVGLWALMVGITYSAAWRARDLHDLLSFEQARRIRENERVDSP